MPASTARSTAAAGTPYEALIPSGPTVTPVRPSSLSSNRIMASDQ
jgi:hypothetical protein